jgi:hypothetical protein
VESLRVAILAGADIIQHCNITGATPIPNATLQMLVERNIASTVLPFTDRRFKWLMDKFGPESPVGQYFAASDQNVRNMVRCGARLMLATDGGVLAPEVTTDPVLVNSWAAPGEDNLSELGQGHFHWLKSMEEKGFPPMEILRAATVNIAKAYRKDKDLGTLEPGKLADLLILDADPLKAAENYRSIHRVIQNGVIVDRSNLPLRPLLTRPPEPSAFGASASRAHPVGRFPLCC